jgi:hypothetical protein
VALAVNVGAVATPELLVTAVAVMLLVRAKVPVAPLAGALKLTVVPSTGLPLTATVACSEENAAPVLTVWGVPEVAATVKPLLVRKKLAERLVPETTAVAVRV